jgi:hypothetical protein
MSRIWDIFGMLISNHVYYILLKIKDNIKENKEVRIIRNDKYKRKCENMWNEEWWDIMMYGVFSDVEIIMEMFT